MMFIVPIVQDSSEDPSQILWHSDSSSGGASALAVLPDGNILSGESHDNGRYGLIKFINFNLLKETRCDKDNVANPHYVSNSTEKETRKVIDVDEFVKKIVNVKFFSKSKVPRDENNLMLQTKIETMHESKHKKCNIM